MGELSDGVEGPTGDFVLCIFFFIEDRFHGGVCEEVEEPEYEDEEPDEPEGD